jgi:hypothetical protein
MTLLKGVLRAIVDLFLMGRRVSEISDTLHMIQHNYEELERRIDALERDLNSIADKLRSIFNGF